LEKSIHCEAPHYVILVVNLKVKARPYDIYNFYSYVQENICTFNYKDNSVNIILKIIDAFSENRRKIWKYTVLA